ncbi:MAG: hypothetical protein HY649_09690 [Acidobacteria bacterium]|nr:hypothetical protein [Acidobacteriota bacterium]
MAKSVRIWQRKQLRLDRLNFRQRDMVEIGAAGLLAVKRRLGLAQGPGDSPAKPLTKRYAIQKSKLRKGNRRDLWLTGRMLKNLTLRTVSENSSKAALTSRKERVKGLANQKIEPWVALSPKNQAAVKEAARRVLAEAKRVR